VPRPDNKEDGLGLRYLDEPSTTQSDPTVLELQLRAKSKRLQYGDVVVRSIEHADKNPAKIEKWIQDISELHRSKPPPQVNYKKNMPEMDQLMEVWPEEFESFLAQNGNALPSPDLDMSLGEYAKTLCSLLDIPTYDNPIESLHQMFTLFIEFRNNPHFQARMQQDQQLSGGTAPVGGAGAGNMRGRDYGAADVLEIEQDYK
jgi:intraflagellar transport protein 46